MFGGEGIYNDCTIVHEMDITSKLESLQQNFDALKQKYTELQANYDHIWNKYKELQKGYQSNMSLDHNE